MVPSDIVGSFSEETMRRGARDRRGLRGEEHRRGQGHRAKRCGYTQILSLGTSIAKEHVGGCAVICVTGYLQGQPEEAKMTSITKRRHIPSDLVVGQWASVGESSSRRDFLLLHDV